ncbi:MAG: glycerophosphodiester phosphodiesterase [Chloroflexia bacterium]|nr:glycerophosphodiester phosphodiesterase [Chloroflexia bacterium]
MLIYGHRGSSGTVPENTLSAFAQAITDGADGVEFDLRATADGVPVVIHDRSLDRIRGRDANVDELTLAEIQAGAANDAEVIPTFEAVLDLLAGRLRLDLELKQPGLEATVRATLRRYPAADWVISSFDWDALRAVRTIDTSAPLWPLATVADEALFAVAAELGAPSIALYAGALTQAVVERSTAAGLDVMVWTVNDVMEARQAQALGVAALCTDHPAAIRAGLIETG